MVVWCGRNHGGVFSRDLLVVVAIKPDVNVIFCAIGEILNGVGVLLGINLCSSSRSKTMYPVFQEIGSHPLRGIPRNGYGLIPRVCDNS